MLMLQRGGHDIWVSFITLVFADGYNSGEDVKSKEQRFSGTGRTIGAPRPTALKSKVVSFILEQGQGQGLFALWAQRGEV